MAEIADVSKVLHLIPTLEGGGAERQLAMLAIAQSSKGMQVHVAVRRLGVYGSMLSAGNVTVHELADVPITDIRIWRDVDALVRGVRPDILQTWITQMDLIGGVIAMVRLVPWVMTQRNEPATWPSANVAEWLRRQIGTSADAIVSNSRVGTKYWQRRAPKTIVKTIHNAIDIDEIRALAQPASRNQPRDRFRILAVGRLIRLKGHDYLMRALARTAIPARVELLVIGEGPEHHSLRRLAESLPSTCEVKFVGYDRGWWRWLNSAHCLVSLSQSEGSPNVVLEAMAAGCPVLLSDIPAHREIADETMAVFVSRAKVDEVGRKLLSILLDPSRSAALAGNAQRKVAELSIASTQAAFYEVYSQIAGKSDSCVR